MRTSLNTIFRRRRKYNVHPGNQNSETYAIIRRNGACIVASLMVRYSRRVRSSPVSFTSCNSKGQNLTFVSIAKSSGIIDTRTEINSIHGSSRDHILRSSLSPMYGACSGSIQIVIPFVQSIRGFF